MEKYDVVVIGSGTGGQTAALELAAEGYLVALVEYSETPGGVCALHGCQAKKYYYEVAELVAKANHLQGKGLTSLPDINWGDICSAKNNFTSTIPENSVANLRGYGVRFYSGTASFGDANTLSVNDQQISATFIVIATGAVPMNLPIKGSEHITTSSDFLSLKSLPEKIVFIGGGFISFELAHFAARLGGRAGQLHIIETMNRPLGPFDGDLVRELTKATEGEGIAVRCNISISSIEKRNDSLIVHLSSGEPIETDLIVHGAGRVAAIKDLQLEKCNIISTPRGIKVDHSMRTNVDNVFAVGDCAESVQLARVADKEAMVAVKNIIAELEGTDEKDVMSYSTVPSVLFTYPQLAMVGQTEEQLQESGVKYWKSFETELSWPTYKRIGLRHAAFKLLVDENNMLLGAHILSDNATGMINTFKKAMESGTNIESLRNQSILSPYPSRESDIVYMLNPLLD